MKLKTRRKLRKNKTIIKFNKGILKTSLNLVSEWDNGIVHRSIIKRYKFYKSLVCKNQTVPRFENGKLGDRNAY